MTTKLKGVLLSDSNVWKEDAIIDLRKNKFITFSHSKKPSAYRSDSIENLKETIKENGYFDIYYLTGNYAYYKARVIDFAINENEFKEKKWIEKHLNIAWYNDNFKDYKYKNKSASIVSLIDKFEKLTNPIHKERFTLYADSKYPTQDNMIPFEFIKGEKITSISFAKDWNQFPKNFKMDFTYPTGHRKAGEPLDKICIIGQSGTGKTTILRSLKNYMKNSLTEEDYVIKTSYEKEESYPSFINIPLNIIEDVNEIEYDYIENKNKKLENVDYFDFEDDITDYWEMILNEIREYLIKTINFRLELTKSINIETITDKIKKWEKNNKNPLKELNEFLKPLLSPLFLKIKDEPKSVKDINFIPITSIKDDKIIPTKYLSSGTKQILVKTVPLFYIKPENSIILIDEPENSLYPDVQKNFIEFIIKETWHEKTNCQFFFATHSPTIASSFDPWEIFELKFNDETGKVEIENYLKKKERNVNNYKFYPKYLRWDSILTKIFDLENEGSSEREKFLQELAYLDEKIIYLKETNKKDDLEKTVKEYKEKADKLAWKINENL